ncbi:MAG: hypothetical protein MRY21_05795 [Simkaniaceae bacterium]|nr:hypothetical protein [Simkaniaceae bacterium]
MIKLISFLCALSFLTADIVSCPELLSTAEQNYSLSGELKREGDFVYLDVDDRYILELIELTDGFKLPPYFGKPGLVGAHISVIYASELQKYGIANFEEFGQTFRFSLKDCEIVHPPHWKGVDSVFLITVDSPELDALREKYDLPPSEFGFHITVGIK